MNCKKIAVSTLMLVTFIIAGCDNVKPMTFEEFKAKEAYCLNKDLKTTVTKNVLGDVIKVHCIDEQSRRFKTP